MTSLKSTSFFNQKSYTMVQKREKIRLKILKYELFQKANAEDNSNKTMLVRFLYFFHCNPLQGKYRFFTGNSLCSISTLTCFGSVQGLKGANFIEIQGNICILYRNIALDSYIHVYVLITGISLLFEKQQHRILEKQGKPCK